VKFSTKTDPSDAVLDPGGILTPVQYILESRLGSSPDFSITQSPSPHHFGKWNVYGLRHS